MSSIHSAGTSAARRRTSRSRRCAIPAFARTSSPRRCAMMADSIEHVISYWMMFQKFHSPALGGFAVVSHWLPFLLFSVLRRRARRPLRSAPHHPARHAAASWACRSRWGVSVHHRHAGDVARDGAARDARLRRRAVEPGEPAAACTTSSAPRSCRARCGSTPTARYLGLLLGPAVGGGIMLLLGPVARHPAQRADLPAAHAVAVESAVRAALSQGQSRAGAPMRGLADISRRCATIAGNRTIVSMTLLAGGASLFVGNAYQAQMPEFAHDLGHGDAGCRLQHAARRRCGRRADRRLRARKPRAAAAASRAPPSSWRCCGAARSAASRSRPRYPLALALLFVAGFLELSFNSMAQTLVQLHAPAHIRGRVIGLYSMSALGMRAFSGRHRRLSGGLIGIHWSLALSATALRAVMLGLLAFSLRR